MITCTVCGRENNDLAVICAGCKGFVQAKVDSLDLFQTMWGVIESPGKTFKRIALSRTKNYVLLLSAITGIAATYALLWSWNIAKVIPELPMILGIGLAAGIPAGFLGFWIVSLLIVGAGKWMGGNGTTRNMYAVLSYAAVPVVLSMVFIFPVEIALFGVYLFDNNPSPFVLKPLPFVVLAGIDGAMVIWSLLLAVIGIRVVHGISLVRALVLLVAGVLLVSVAVVFTGGGG